MAGHKYKLGESWGTGHNITSIGGQFNRLIVSVRLQCETRRETKKEQETGDSESADTKQWYLINDDKCRIQARFLTILGYCFGGNLPLATEITRQQSGLADKLE